MKAAGFVGAVTEGDSLKVVKLDELETLAPGLYSLGRRRWASGRYYDVIEGRFAYLAEQPQELLARVMLTDLIPLGTAQAYRRKEDGKAVVIFWQSELEVPEIAESDFITAPE